MKVKRFLAATALMASVAAFANQPKYVFLMIGDGMGPGPVMAAQNYLRLGSETPEAKMNMLQMPVSA